MAKHRIALVPLIYFISISTLLGSSSGQDAVLKIITDLYDPFFLDESERGLTGIAHDVIVRAFKEEGQEVKFLIMPFARTVSEFMSGAYPVGFFDEATLNAVVKTPQTCSPFFSYHAVLFFDQHYHREWVNKSDLDLITGKSVGMLRGNEHERLVLTQLGLKAETTNSHRSLVSILSLGRIDLMSTVDLTGFRSVRRYLPKRKWADIQVFGEPYYTGKAGLCFRGKDAEKNKAIFDKGMSKMKLSGEYETIVKSKLKEIIPDRLHEYYKKYWM